MQVSAESRDWSGLVIGDQGSCPSGEEALWVLRARSGDEEAFNWLLDRYRDRVARLAAHILRNEADAEDAAQTAFVRAFRNIRRYRGDCRFYTWLYRITMNECLNQLKSSARRKARQEEHLADSRMWQGGCEESSLGRMLIEKILDELSPPLRAALVLREMEGLDYTEIAEALDIPVGTVRSRLNSARLRFRELWQEARQEAENV